MQGALSDGVERSSESFYLFFFKEVESLRKEAGPVGKGETKKRGGASSVQEAWPVGKGETKKGVGLVFRRWDQQERDGVRE